MFGIRELKDRVERLEWLHQNPPKYKVGDSIKDVTIYKTIINPRYHSWLGTEIDFSWSYYGVKKGSDKLIEVK